MPKFVINIDSLNVEGPFVADDEVTEEVETATDDDLENLYVLDTDTNRLVTAEDFNK